METPPPLLKELFTLCCAGQVRVFLFHTKQIYAFDLVDVVKRRSSPTLLVDVPADYGQQNRGGGGEGGGGNSNGDDGDRKRLRVAFIWRGRMSVTPEEERSARSMHSKFNDLKRDGRIERYMSSVTTLVRFWYHSVLHFLTQIDRMRERNSQ